MNTIETKLIDRAQIEAAEMSLIDAIRSSDLRKLSRLLHKDLLFTIPTGETVTKEIELSNFNSGNLKVEKVSSRIREISIIDNTAVVIVELNLAGYFMGQSIDGKYKYTRVWKLIENSWMIIGGAGMKM